MTGAGPGPGPDPEREPADAGSASPDAVEQLQRALLTLIGAARVGLDALEAVVSDRGRLDELARRGREVVDALGTDRTRARRDGGDR